MSASCPRDSESFRPGNRRAHIYLGTIGMTGAYKGMRTGYVDETWAREHHEYWYEDIRAGRIPAQRSQPLARGEDVETVRPA